jgi:hypothetical protein
MSQESDHQTLRDLTFAAYRDGRATFVARFTLTQWRSPAGEITAWMDRIARADVSGCPTTP